MLTQSFTHKSHKITTLTTDSYKQLFVLITMLLTVLSVQPSTFTMAAPLQHQPQQYQLTQPQLQHNLPHDTLHHSQLPEILLADEKVHRYDHHHNYIYHNHQRHRQQQRHLQHQQLETDLIRNEEEEYDGDDEEKIHKREISWHDYYNSIMQSQAINWYNPCGGFSKMDEKPVKRKRPPPIKKELRKLQYTIAKNYNLIKSTLHAINIRNMKQWDLGEQYSFLPKLNTNSSISLRRWHRHLQIYVAAFEYLRRAQLHFDYVRDSQESPFARELNDLMKDARNILCNIEHAINNTTTRKSASNIDSLFISRTRMEGIFNFTTNIKYVSPLKWQQIKTDDKNWMVNEIDLRFAKSHYLAFVRKLMKILRIHTKRPGPIYLGKNGNGNKKQSEQNRQLQQQKKSQNQHKTKLRHTKNNSNKYYNENTFS